MMIDWGMGLERQRDTVSSGGHLIDFAKIAAGIARFMPEDVLTCKLRHYTDHDISTSPGGLFAEAALGTDEYPEFLTEVVRLGFTGVEVSDNLIDLTPEVKARAIELAASKGLTVFGEVGKKDAITNDDEFIADINNCLGAWSDYVFLDAAELFVDGTVRDELIKKINRECKSEILMYELPVELLPQVTRTQKHHVCADLVREMGTNVNLANIEWDELYQTEIARCGFAGDTSHPEGVYARAGIGQ